MSNNYSAAPGTPQTADKAKTAALVTGILVAVLVGAARYFDDRNGTNITEILSAILAGLASAGVTGAATFKAQNKPVGTITNDRDTL